MSRLVHGVGSDRSRLYAKVDHDPHDLRRTAVPLYFQRVRASECSSLRQHALRGDPHRLGLAQLSLGPRAGDPPDAHRGISAAATIMFLHRSSPFDVVPRSVHALPGRCYGWG